MTLSTMTIYDLALVRHLHRVGFQHAQQYAQPYLFAFIPIPDGSTARRSPDRPRPTDTARHRRCIIGQPVATLSSHHPRLCNGTSLKEKGEDGGLQGIVRKMTKDDVRVGEGRAEAFGQAARLFWPGGRGPTVIPLFVCVFKSCILSPAHNHPREIIAFPLPHVWDGTGYKHVNQQATAYCGCVGGAACVAG
jgi:hypothetical protein